jgi:hypothetical protein
VQPPEMSKSSKHRPCPAAQREITSAECGEHRNSKYLCPADCPFNPFAPANYSQLLEMEQRLDQLAFKALVSEPIHGPLVQRRFEKVGYDDPGFSNVVLWEMYYRKDVDGLSFAQRYQNPGLSDFKNDLRNLFRAKCSIHVSLLEFQTVIDEQSTLCRDLLQPSRPPILLLDRSAAARACRFDVLLSQCYDLPHFSRIFGTAIPIPFMQSIEAIDIVRELVAHLKGPRELPELRLWLAEHFNEFTEALWATNEARRKASLANSNLQFSKAVYRLQAPYAECRAALDRIEDVAPDRLTKEQSDEGFSDARVWFASEDDLKVRHNVGREALGTILLGQALWRLETLSKARMEQLQHQFESALGARVQLEGVRIDDLPNVAEAKIQTPNSLVPPSLLQNIPQLSISTSRISPVEAQMDRGSMEERLFRSADESFLNDSIPLIDGATPLAAAKDPALLGKLRQLLRQRINGADRNNLAKGSRYDAAWLAAELGQQDLCTPMPPKRPPLNLDQPSIPEPEFEESSDLPPAPTLPLHLDRETAIQRMDQALEAFPNLLDLQEEALEAGCTWPMDVEDFLGKKLSDDEYHAVTVAFLEAWFAMVPLGFSGPEISLHSVTDRLARVSEKIKDGPDSNDLSGLPSHLKSEYQIHIGEIVTLTFLEICKEKKLIKQKEASKTFFLIVVILAFIDEMHLALADQSASTIQ